MRQEIQLVSDDAEYKLQRSRFISSCSLSSITCITKDFSLDISKETFAESLEQIAHSTGLFSSFRSYSVDSRYLTYEFDNTLMVQINCDGIGSYGPYDFAISFNNLNVTFISSVYISNKIIDGLINLYGDGSLVTAKWFYNTKGSAPEYVSIPLSPSYPITDSMYPMLNGVDSYLDSYLGSHASVLFMMGEAGTGKSNLIRYLAYKYKLTAYITYDQELLSSDELFVNFMKSTDKSVLILEDADLLVTSRDGDNNNFVSRFLNVSDGLIKSSTKKMIFTTNQNDFRHVDQALIRAGRCFGALKFRPLTYDEICIVADDVGRERPVERRDYTLADFFNPESNQTVDLSKIGF